MPFNKRFTGFFFVCLLSQTALSREYLSLPAEVRSHETYLHQYQWAAKAPSIEGTKTAPSSSWPYAVPMSPTAYTLLRGIRLSLDTNPYFTEVSDLPVFAGRFRLLRSLTLGLGFPVWNGRDAVFDAKWNFLNWGHHSFALLAWTHRTLATTMYYGARTHEGVALAYSRILSPASKLHFSLGLSSAERSYDTRNFYRLTAVYDWAFATRKNCYLSISTYLNRQSFNYPPDYGITLRHSGVLLGAGYQARLFSSVGLMLGIELGPRWTTFGSPYHASDTSSLDLRATGNGSVYVDL